MFISWFRIRFVALAAAIPLLTFARLSKSPAFGSAIMTCHFGLPFPRGKPIIFLGSALRLARVLDLAPSPVAPEGGAFVLAVDLKTKTPKNSISVSRYKCSGRQTNGYGHNLFYRKMVSTD